MAGSNILSDIMNLNDFDLNSHLNTYMDDIDEIDNPLSNLAINSKYYDITDLRIDSELNGHKHQLLTLPDYYHQHYHSFLHLARTHMDTVRDMH